MQHIMLVYVAYKAWEFGVGTHLFAVSTVMYLKA